ncbi:MAG: tripartite tricarboxylate transporter TctB family protein, partial [Burkholderiaceae bacterium]
MSDPTEARVRRGWLNAYNKDYYGGGLMFLLGVGAVMKGFQYKIGSLSRMGPGYFPVAVGVVLAVMGILIALGARSNVVVPTGKDVHHP